ncbi:hypothetical protein [Christiangramia echinicola]|uniref:hypothetical protein n=1 Tax=Christiangramia echinicola TaxID=279359 RepID=UPI0003FB3B32|nr:hypothetical protein [Christiangramia echinicola]
MRTKLLLKLILVLLLVGCSVDPIEEDLMKYPATEVNAGVDEYGCAGEDKIQTITLAEASAIESWDEVRKLYLSMLDLGTPKDGAFDPAIWDLIDAFNDPERESQLGDYTTTYSLSSDDCFDSVQLTIRVIPDSSDPICELYAGEDASRELQFGEASAIESWDEVRKLYLSLLEPGVSRNGSFDPSIWDLIDAFNDGSDPLGEYTTIYTIIDGDCSDSVELTITVVPDRADPPFCDLDAGPDNVKTLTRSEAAALPSWDEVRKLYLSLLAPGIPKNGSFDPSIWDLINQFNEPGDNLGDYTTVYTLTDGECRDTVKLTIRVIED